MTSNNNLDLSVGFVGLGKMGRPMALNLVSAGFDTVVFNRTRSAAGPVVEAGASEATSPRELAGRADVLITMLPDGAAVGAVLEGPDGLLAGMRSGQILIEMSTIGPVAARHLGAKVKAAGAEMIDSPVSGSIPAATDGSLLAMVGGSRTAFDSVQPVLAALTARQIHLGELGGGAAMKLMVNAMIGITNLALAESLVLAERVGIERATAYEVIAGSAIASPYVQYKREAFLDPDGAEVFFSNRLMQKDLDLALALGREAESPLFATAAARESLSMATAAGFGKSDLTRVADAFRQLHADSTAGVGA